MNEKNTAPIPININSDATPRTTVEGVEPLLTLDEVASLLGWSYDGTRRYFKDLPGVLLKFQPRRYKRPYRQYTDSEVCAPAEWQKMAGYNTQSGKAA